MSDNDAMSDDLREKICAYIEHEAGHGSLLSGSIPVGGRIVRLGQDKRTEAYLT